MSITRDSIAQKQVASPKDAGRQAVNDVRNNRHVDGGYKVTSMLFIAKAVLR